MSGSRNIIARGQARAAGAGRGWRRFAALVLAALSGGLRPRLLAGAASRLWSNVGDRAIGAAPRRQLSAWGRASVPVVGAVVLIALLAAVAAQLAVAQPGGLPGHFPEHRIERLRFVAVDVFVDSGAVSLGAYQVEIKAAGGAGATPDVKLVGVEGGEHAAYTRPPYYDPAALHENAMRERIVIAAFSTAKELPAGKTRVARLHVQVSGGEPSFVVKVETAGAGDGARIEATAAWAPVDAGTGDRR